METREFEISEDIRIMCVAADSFPAGVQDAYSQLESILTGKSSSPADSWRYHLDGYEVYGLTKMEQGKMVYKACAKECFEGEAESHHLAVDTIPAGKYICFSLIGWQEKKEGIATIFHHLFSLPEASKTAGICLEYYKSPVEVVLMVKRA